MKQDYDRDKQPPSAAEVVDAFSQLTPRQQTLLRLLQEGGALKPLLEDLKRNIELTQAKPAGEA